MPKDHLALALAIEPTYLTTLVDRNKSVLPCACYAVLATECVFTMSAATPKHVACPEWPGPNHFDFYAPR